MNSADSATPAKDLFFVGTSDLAGLIRGKSFPAEELDHRSKCGVGWTPTNVQLTCFDTIAPSPFGALGDLALVPDLETRVQVAQGDGRNLDFALGDIRTMEGEPWEYCTRYLARRAIEELKSLTGAIPFVGFEHEFQLRPIPERRGDSYGFKGFRDAQQWAEVLLRAMDDAGCKPDTFMKEYGPGQYEITNKPALGLAALDNAAILRLLVHDVLPRHGAVPTFTPIFDPESVGNGVHIHCSFRDEQGNPLTHDDEGPAGMSELTRHFIGGLLAHLDQILAILAPSEISYLRLVPHRWSAAFDNLGYRDREASVRICPVNASAPDTIAEQFNFEIRAVDAAGSPHLVFAAILFAGIQGVRDRTEPPEPTAEDLSLLSSEALAARGFSRLPTSLPAALERFGDSSATRRWFGGDFVDLYVAHKTAELDHLKDHDWPAKCGLYASVY